MKDPHEWRIFLGTLAGCLAVLRRAHAQQAGKVYRVGYLGSGTALEAPLQRALENGFRDLGYAPGQRILLEYRFSELSAERLREFASEFVHMPVDLILADTNSAVAAAKQATTLIPIVMIVGTGVVHAGLIQSLARLGGNVTGLTADSAPETILAKQVATLQECVPNLRKLGVLWNPNAPGYRIYFDILEAQASQLHVEVQSLEVTSPDTVGAAFQAAKKNNLNGMIVFVDILTFGRRRDITTLATKYRIPTVAYVREFADAGGLLAYGANLADMHRRAAYYVDRIIKGAKPGDLPVEQPTKFELVVNLKTAKALGLTISPSLLARADQVIE